MVFSALIVFALFGITKLVNFGAFDLYRLAFKEFSFLDTYYAQKMKADSQKINQDIIIINVNHLSRAKLAVLLAEIQREKPKVIGVDVIFNNSKKFLVKNDELQKQLQKENVVSAYAFKNREIIKNEADLGVFRHKLGYANFNFDEYNSIIRNFQPKYNLNGFTYTSFGVRVAQRFYGAQKTFYWENNKKSIPINYSGGLNHYYTFEAEEILKQEATPLLEDKIILLGYLGSFIGNVFDIEDKHYTPLNQEFMGKSMPDTFGVIIHANIIEMLINNNELYQSPTWSLILIAFIVTFFSIAYFLRLNKKRIELYMLVRKLTQLGFTILFVWIALWLLSLNIYFKITELIWYVVLSIECIWAYKILSIYLKKQFGWESYFFQD